ncbi:MAG: GyrI-like domain-containing protein [Candidatus Bathyarchaeota archaeon]|nr:GyrI-like domain-containing protein [Candidatus Bathyarchaeum sp.]
MSEPFLIVNIEPKLVLGTRKIGPYKLIGELIPQVCQYAAQNGIQMIGPPIYICHETNVEDATKADKEGTADVEVAIPILKRGKETKEITCYKLPAAKMVKTVHKGPYREEGTTYERLFVWLEKNKKTITGPIREIYLNDPHEVSEEELLIEIYAPID